MAESSQITTVSIVGLGKLGAPIAAAMAQRGLTVIGVDSDVSKVTAIQRGQPPVVEPGLGALLTQTGGRLTATTDLRAAVEGSDATFIIVPTPSESDGRFSLRYVLGVCEKLGAALRTKRGYHLVVVTSTVMPGDTGGTVRQTLEQHSGQLVGENLGLCYSPEFVALGSVIRDFLNPELVLIGESDDRAGQALADVTLRWTLTRPQVVRMNFVNAELAKLAVNTYVTTKITYANMLAALCQQLPGADVDVVTQAIGFDSRIGQRYLRGGLGYGGPCFPRDNVAMAALAREAGAQADLAEAVDAINRRGVDRLAKLIQSQIQPHQTVAVLGLAYKPDTDVVEQSQGLQLAARLANDGTKVIAFDPWAVGNAKPLLPASVRFAPSLGAAIDAADVVVIATAWAQFADLDPADLGRSGDRRMVIDCWRCLNPKRIEPVADYVAIGVGSAGRAAALAEVPAPSAAAVSGPQDFSTDYAPIPFPAPAAGTCPTPAAEDRTIGHRAKTGT